MFNPFQNLTEWNVLETSQLLSQNIIYKRLAHVCAVVFPRKITSHPRGWCSSCIGFIYLCFIL